MFGAFQVGAFQLAYQQVATAVQETFSGGYWWVRYEAERERRRRRRRELEDLEDDRERIADAQAREIALLLQEQERQDARREELARLSSLVEAYTSSKTDGELSPRVLKAIEKAAQKQTEWALMALEREIKAAEEEEEFTLHALWLTLND